MIKNNLSVLMAERDLKIADVYEDTGISKTTLMALAENNGKGVQYETIDKLCNYLEVSPSEFFIYAPYITKIEEANWKADEHIYNFMYSIQSGESEIDYDVLVNLYSGNYGYMDEVLSSDKNTNSYNFVFYIEVDGGGKDDSFSSFYHSLPIQFRKTVRENLFSKIIEYINSDNPTYMTTGKDGKLKFGTFNNYLVNRPLVSILFVIDGREHDIFTKKRLKIKDGKFLYK